MCVWDHLKCSSNHTRSSTCSSWKFALLDKAANTFLELCLDYAIRGATEHSRNFGSFFLTYVWVACLFCSEQISSRMEEEAVRPTVWFNYEVGVFLKQTRLFETLLVGAHFTDRFPRIVMCDDILNMHSQVCRAFGFDRSLDSHYSQWLIGVSFRFISK